MLPFKRSGAKKGRQAVNAQELERTARSPVAEGKVILAAEGFGTIGKRLEEVGIESSEKSRRDYRELLFKTSGISDCFGGVIPFDETIRQKTSGVKLLAEVLKEQGVVPNIVFLSGRQSAEQATAHPGAMDLL